MKIVIAGLDPAIHSTVCASRWMDSRVKPANDKLLLCDSVSLW